MSDVYTKYQQQQNNNHNNTSTILRKYFGSGQHEVGSKGFNQSQSADNHNQPIGEEIQWFM